jgi:hypothetical protein
MSNGGNPLVNTPPSSVTVDLSNIPDADPRKRAALEALGRKDAGEQNGFWASFWASVKSGVLTLVKDFTGTLDEILALIGDFFHAAQGEGTTGFYDLSATILGDLTGVEVNKEALKNSAFGSGRLAAMQEFGANLYKLLEQEFKPASGDLETGDTAPAEKFLGFLMNFAIRQGNIELLCSMIPEEYRFADGFRAYGELMAKNLGLGRMARRALQPLIQILVADPLMYQLQKQYRPKRIGASPAIKKFFRDPTFQPKLLEELAQEGYTDERINDLIEEMRPLLAERQLIEYGFRFGEQTGSVGGAAVPGTKDLLMQRGFTDAEAQKLIDISRPSLKENEVGVLFANGVIEHQVASDYLAKLGYDSDTAELVLRAHSLQHQHARRIGLAELKRAFHNSVIDLLELKAHLTAQGYSDDDIQIITLDLLQPATGKVRQLSLAEIKAGFKAGVLTEAQAAEHLKTLGYLDADIAVIVKTLTPPKAPATAGTPPTTPPGTPQAGG